MGLTISAVEIPLLTVYATVLAFLQLFRPRKSLTGKINHPEEAAGIWDEEWDLDSVATGKSYIIEGSNNSGQSIYIELVTHDTYNSATIVLGDAMRTIGGQFSGAIVDNRTIKCGPLFVEMREPFRRWRITFKGYLENDQERNFVSLAGWWKPTADARFFYSDLTASSLRFSKNFDVQSNIEYLSKAHFSDHLSQFGQYHAEVTIDGISSELRFRGIRQFGSYKNIQAADEFHAYLEDGNRVSYRSVTCEGHSVTINHGYVDKANRQCTSVSLPDESVLSTDNNRLIEFKPAHCSTLLGVLPFPLRKGEICSTYSYFSSTGHEVKLKRVKVNHALSTGFALLRTVRESLKEVEHPQFHSFEDVTATDAAKQRKVVPFSLRSCQDKEFTGGKGANLAKLKSMEHKYVVPNGAVITTTAFNSFLEANSDIKKLVQILSAKGLSVEEYVLQGELIHEAIMKASPPSELHLLLEEAGIVSDNKIKYAVRSSAVGEDGSDLSSAGQLESVLNVPFDDIPAKVLECWCSNFRREVISYRRNYGQELNPSMAVVVQEMITDGCAGVMFTCDPVKNNDGRLVINAIRGCGEDIVSGVVTPDEIIVEKKTLQMSKPDNCCLDDDSLHNLVNVGLFLEGIFGTAQDVEFVMKGTKVFLVQSRDVTGRDRESRFELLSEFDNATLTDKEIFTTANVGEVVPAPMSPLEISQTSGLYDSTMANMILKDLPGTHLTRHNNTTFHTYGQRMLLNIGEMFLRQHSVMKNDRLAEISIAGCHIFTEEMFKQAEVRYGPVPKLFPLKRLQVIGHMMFIRSYRIMDEIHAELKKSEQLTPTGEITFESLLETLNKQLLLYRTILEMHSGASVFSSFTHIVVGMLIRGSPEGDTTPDMLSDLARIFSNSSTTVISADVPAALEKLAKAIKEDGLQQEFLAAADNEAVNLLKTKGRLSAEQIDDFLKVHGHRGPKELYIRSDGWAEKPELLVVTLKTMLSSKMEEKPSNNTTIDELLDSLKCQPKGFKRQMMKYMVKESHRGVASRELAKSCLVKAVYECRKTSKMIAKMLYENGLVPDEDLYFFLHLDEVKTLWKTRSAKLIARAMRRRQIFPEFEERRYAHVYYGNPEPLNLKTADDSATEVSLTGTVVCEGKVVAKARVAVNLEEAKHTQSGEILITRCTDICWSPFFPIIKGIVTEIGGLLSHGAVVAREYGLPSLIAVENATAVFRTGDLVELDTHKGTISKITMFSS